MMNSFWTRKIDSSINHYVYSLHTERIVPYCLLFVVSNKKLLPKELAKKTQLLLVDLYI